MICTQSTHLLYTKRSWHTISIQDKNVYLPHYYLAYKYNMRIRQLLYLISCLFVFCPSSGKSQEIMFNHLTTNNGLSNNSVRCLYQDKKGFIWMGTRNGVNLYNGNEFITYKVRKNNPNSLNYNSILDITGNEKDEIYFMTSKGISMLKTLEEQYSTLIQGNIRSMYYYKQLYISIDRDIYYYDGKQFKDFYQLEIPEQTHISAIHVCDETMMIGTTNQGLFSLNLHTQQLTRIIPDNQIIDIFKDSTGKYWIGTIENGIYLINGSSLTNFRHTKNDPGSLSSNYIRDFCEDKQGNIWIGTFDGLNQFDAQTQTFHCYRKNDREQSLTHSSVWSLLCDKQGTIWIGTYFGGVNYFTPQKQIFLHFQASKNEKEGLSSPIVGRIIEDKKHNLWIGTEGGGINVYNPQKRSFQWFRHNKEKNSLSQDNVKALYYDSTNEVLWIGTHMGGLNKLDMHSGHFTHYLSDKNDPESIPSNNIGDITSYKKQLILATHLGVCLFNPSTGKSKPLFQEEPYKIEYANTLCIDHQGTLWVNGNGEGVYSYQFDTKKIKIYSYNPALEHSINSNSINRIYEDSQKRLWFCSNESGIDLYRYKTDDFENFDEQKNGLISNCVYDVCELSPNKLLFVTDVGFSILNYNTRVFTNYTKDNGVPLSAMNERSLYKTSEGKILIGGMNGMIAFHEKDLVHTPISYEIHPFRLIVNGEEIKINDNTHILTKKLSNTPAIKLKYSQSAFSIEYAITNYIPFNKDEIEYFMEGFSKKWMSTRGQPMITYTNLNPGKYILLVRAKNNPLVPESKLEIEILPPFYQTKWAYILYIFCIGIISYYLIRTYNNRIKLQESLKYEKKHAEDIEQLNQTKLRFFTNISHEFRTPLTLIIGQMEMLLQIRSFSPSIYNRILSAYKNCLQMRELITELLDFRKQEQGYMTIKASEYNIVDFVYENHLLFQEYALQQHITFKFNKTHDNIPLWYDKRQLQKVMNNLISNAFKHTPEGGEITVSVRKGNKEVVIEVTDNGSGIAPKDIKNIFDRFYQIEQPTSLPTGTGIGLALTKGIVELHHGSIEVYSEPGEGTTFCVHIPTGNEHFTPEQICGSTTDSSIDNTVLLEIATNLPEEQEISNSDLYNEQKREIKILIVEDNEPLRKMLTGIFAPFYQVITACDGKEGWEKVQSEHPHIVLSDVVMPNVSGTDLCKLIKGHLESCHIPVVLLTARTAIEHTLEGLRLGADDYITKPFNINILLSRCNNLINNRIMLQEKFSKHPQEIPQILATNAMDKELVDKAMRVIDRYIDNAEFNVDILAREMGIARTKLFNKLKDITGQTPYDFIVTIRLKRSAIMLKERPEFNISEISDKLGFSSPRQFSKSFKDKYHTTPQAYRKGEATEKDNQIESFS